MSREISVGITISKYNIISFIPVNIKINPTPNLMHLNILFNLTNKKYKLRSPKIANIFEVYTMSGLVVIENIAGIESSAKIISELSIKINTINKGVA